MLCADRVGPKVEFLLPNGPPCHMSGDIVVNDAAFDGNIQDRPDDEGGVVECRRTSLTSSSPIEAVLLGQIAQVGLFQGWPGPLKQVHPASVVFFRPWLDVRIGLQALQIELLGFAEGHLSSTPLNRQLALGCLPLFLFFVVQTEFGYGKDVGLQTAANQASLNSDTKPVHSVGAITDKVGKVRLLPVT